MKELSPTGARIARFAKRLSMVAALALCASMPLAAQQAASRANLTYNFTDKAAHEALFGPNPSAQIEWVSDFGRGDRASLKVQHIEGMPYVGAENAVRLTFPEPLPAGTEYQIIVSFYVPTKGNSGKTTLTGPGVVLNGAYAKDAFKFPPNFGTMPVDEWKEVNIKTLFMEEPLRSVDFRFVVNEKEKHPDLWYIDEIRIIQLSDAKELIKPEWQMSLPSLREKYQDKFFIGNILSAADLRDPQTLEMFKHHYNIMTAENDMKAAYLSSGKGFYYFTRADAMVDWSVENGIAINGHTLVWHSQSAKWLTNNENGDILTRKEAFENMKAYIEAVMGQYKGKFLSWEVVNEAFDGGSEIPTDWRTVLRKESPWYKAYENGANRRRGEGGGDFIYDAFVIARQTDPSAVLYYNDYNETDAWKREAIALMVEDLNAKWAKDRRNRDKSRPLIEGIGMQSHYWVGDLNVSAVEESIKRFIKTGARISVTELDIPAGTYSKRAVPPLSRNDEIAQARLYAELFKVYVKYADYIDRVTFWAKADPQSWRQWGSPALFDKYFKAKLAYEAVMDPEGFLKKYP